MQRSVLLVAMVLSCILTAILNVVIAHHTTLNLFTLRIWFIIPVGALIVGAAAASGALLAAWYLHIRPSWTQAFLSAVVVGVTTMALIYYIEYATLVIDGKYVSDYIGFSEYLDISITKSHTRFGRSQKDIGEIGELGYTIALLELVAFVVGALGVFAILDTLPKCAKCAAYLRSRKSSTSKELTVEEASALHDKFRTGDLETVRTVMAWEPEKRTLPAGHPKAKLLFKLLQCPKCAEQTVVADVQVAKEKNNWRETKGLKVLRVLGPGVTL